MGNGGASRIPDSPVHGPQKDGRTPALARSFLTRLCARLCGAERQTLSALSPADARAQLDELRSRLFRPNPNVPERGLAFAEEVSIPQELQFAIDCLPTLTELIRQYPRGRRLSLLDYGPGYGAGSNLIASLFRSELLWTPVDVDALDIKDLRKDLADLEFPRINYRVGDLEDLPPEQKWDIVYCSNVIEHTTDPRGLIERLRSRARGWLLVYAPYREQELSPGHRVSIDESIFAPFSPSKIEIRTSLAWNLSPEHRQILAVIVGEG